MTECDQCGAIAPEDTCTLYETTLLMVAWTHDNSHLEPVIHVTLPWGVTENWQRFSVGETKTYYEPDNETNFREVNYVSKQGNEAVFDICYEPIIPKDTKCTCYDKTAAPGASVVFKALVQENDYPYSAVRGLKCKFYCDGYKCYDYSNGSGISECSADAPTTPGAYQIKALFFSKGGYNGCSCYGALTVEEPTCSQQFYLVDNDTGEYITGATVKVGGVECEHEYLSIERYQKDDLVEGSWYDVVASKSGYTCPDDICKNTFKACDSAITLKLKAPPKPCSEYTTESSCISAGCFWYNNACHDYGPVQCSDYTDALTCVANNCYWWSDGTCHDTEEPTKGKIESISCTATKEAENDYEITSVVTVKNTDTVNHKYRIKMYDSEGTHLDDEPDELDPKPEVAPGGTIDIALTTIGSVPNARTPEILCELYDIKIGADEFIVSETKQCLEVNIGEITKIACSYVKQGELEYEIEAIVEFKNPDNISHLYKVELLDGKTGESKDWNPGKLSAGKDVAAGESSAITVSTTGLGYCSSPLILIKLWETTGFLAVADEQEYDCSAPEDEESIWKTIADLLGLTVPQVKAIVMAGGGLLALSFIMPLFRR